MPFVRRTVPHAGAALAVLTFEGGGAARVRAHFLHANGFAAGVYAPFLEHLAETLALVASDVRGQGDSRPAPPLPLRSWTGLADDVAAVVAATGGGPVLGLGHSMGGTITAIAAARHPELFQALVLVDPVLLSPSHLALAAVARRVGLARRLPLVEGALRRRRRFPSRAEALARFAGGRGLFRTWRPEFVAAYVEHALERDPEGASAEAVRLKCAPEVEAAYFASPPLDTWRWLGRVRCPVLVLRGAEGSTLRPAVRRRLERTVPGVTIEVVPGTTHFLPMEKPADVAERALAFAARHGASTDTADQGNSALPRTVTRR